MNAELLPCPFCNHSMMHMRLIGQMQQAHCDGCGAAGPLFTEPEPAIAAWNTRPSQPLVEVQEPATEAEVRAVMGKAGFDPSANSWSGGIEEMRHVIAAAAPVRVLPLTEAEIDDINIRTLGHQHFAREILKAVGIGSSAPGGDGESP